MSTAIRKAGSERNLAKILGTHKSAVYFYKYKNRPIRKDVFFKLSELLGLEESDLSQLISKKLEKNWKQKIGGKNCYMKKIKSGKFKRNLIKMKKASSARHEKLKKELGKRYFLDQYNRFKKIGIYKIKTDRGEFVRNTLEKRVADNLFQLGLDYEYEPCIKTNKNYYFPDFRVNRFIIECTMWRGSDKAIKLSKKIDNYKKLEYKVLVVVPNNLRKFYKSIEDNLIEERNITNIFSPRKEPS
jgi:hypothetical protein